MLREDYGMECLQRSARLSRLEGNLVSMKKSEEGGEETTDTIINRLGKKRSQIFCTYLRMADSTSPKIFFKYIVRCKKIDILQNIFMRESRTLCWKGCWSQKQLIRDKHREGN